MIAAEGILTAKGGVSSHAALVARQMGKVCVCGVSALQIDYGKRTLTVDGQTFNEGDFLSIDGTLGTVYAGEVKTAPAEVIQANCATPPENGADDFSALGRRGLVHAHCA